MTITLYCQTCSKDNDELLDMVPIGPLWFNAETKSQTQKYECLHCGHSAILVMLPGDVNFHER